MIPGSATAEGTERFRRRFAPSTADGHFRRLGDLWLSSIGLGTYLGEADEATDRGYEEAVAAALEAGCNVFDSAINYRHQRSERAVGRALARAFESGAARRDEVFVSTKGGFLPFDGDLPDDPAGWLRTAYLDSGLLAQADLAAGCHALAPDFLADQLARSRRNLGLESIDLYYLHNPETQLEHGAEEAASRFESAFAWLGERVREGSVARFGVATWDALRTPAGALGRLELAALRGSAGADPGLAAVQLPLNLAMPEALARPTQELEGATVPLLAAARKLGVAVFCSASILQGRLARGLPPEIRAAMPDHATDAQRALEFTRSAPGVTTALVGMARAEHVEENLALAAVEPAGPELYRRLFAGA